MLDAGTRTVEEAQAERKALVGWPHPSPAAIRFAISREVFEHNMRAMKEGRKPLDADINRIISRAFHRAACGEFDL